MINHSVTQVRVINGLVCEFPALLDYLLSFTDASAVAIAAILLQRQDSGSLAPVAYYSQATNEAESKYH
ncbi:hypothetical protein ALC60_14491 [Trachymyrmex zeteki]|uniref:Reverse transcriptase/retrotransposon-derived protein RNase H-like domain-containing protein n=1 Tax=Mycetomoellerius zeteki TaxID=64791 RepID=A0A151WF91_9HYME|nr:hypothetical protein ALC60_14491 [Trachymyrmex zeteki]